MNLEKRIAAFALLGNFLREQLAAAKKNETNALAQAMRNAEIENAWFTADNIYKALDGILVFLEHKTLTDWILNYNISENLPPKKVGVIMAGNLPMVGFHDLLSVLICGHTLKVKLSSKDSILMKYLINSLISIENSFENSIEIVEQNLKDIDTIIATGSDNTSRHFEFYFAKYKHIIRKNRSSVAVISGSETETEMKALAHDLFLYFGLGCRNVSKLYLPNNYDITQLFPHFVEFEHLIQHNKYANNYQYQRALLAMNNSEHFDTGFALFSLNPSLYAPIGIVNYQFYNQKDTLISELQSLTEQLQCIATNDSEIVTKMPQNTVALGQTQFPKINQYADNVDTIQFLIS